MKKVCVVYSSRYGHSEKYAKWLSEELGAPCFDLKKAREHDLELYNKFVFFGGVYKGNINDFSAFCRRLNMLRVTDLAVAACGLGDIHGQQYIEKLSKSIEDIIPDSLKGNFKLFTLPGGIEYKKMGLYHKWLTYLAFKKFSKKDESQLKEYEKLVIKSYKGAVDMTDRLTLAPVAEYVKGFSENESTTE